MIEGGCLQVSSFSCVENGFPLLRKLNQKRACAIVPLFSRRQLHKKDDLCNCSPFFAATIAQKGRFMQLLALFRANNCTASAEGNAFSNVSHVASKTIHASVLKKWNVHFSLIFQQKLHKKADLCNF